MGLPKNWKLLEGTLDPTKDKGEVYKSDTFLELALSETSIMQFAYVRVFDHVGKLF